MSIGVHNPTIAYVDLSNKTAVAKENDKDGFRKAVNQAEGGTPVYAVKSHPNGTSVVDDFKRKNPDKAGGVNRMVSSGIKAREMYGVSGIRTEDMTMDEYKDYITGILDQIPFHSSRPYDEEAMYISDAGWEQMKKDPDYEAWVLGYTVENRGVRNPFAGLGDMGAYGIEHFGASIEEHHGEGFSKVYGGTAQGARSLFEAAASDKGAIRKNAPRSTEQPPKDWSLAEEQRKKRKRKDFWDEIFETQLSYRRQLKERLNRAYLDTSRTEHYRMRSAFTNSSLQAVQM